MHRIIAPEGGRPNDERARACTFIEESNRAQAFVIRHQNVNSNKDTFGNFCSSLSRRRMGTADKVLKEAST